MLFTPFKFILELYCGRTGSLQHTKLFKKLLYRDDDEDDS